LLELQDKQTIKQRDGEKQIASIGRALAQETELILLDEPIAFLDYENKHIILRILQNIAHQKNLCIVHSSHDLELCREYSNRLLIIDPITKTLNEYEVDKITKENIINIAFPSILQTTNR
jgi:iron complex transport system ATP-binding protein